ncbi:MAG: GNAT family N-acetyltransferase [Demequinaceae bacterium]|nr:GNAT family N-acetyltransferase [Demequinaceae bacterium]
MLTVRAVSYGDADASRLWVASWDELRERYGTLHGPSDVGAEGLIVSLVGYFGDEAVGSVVVRFSEFDGKAAAAEVKRLYVVPERRGNGFSRVLMGAAEDAARRAGATRIIVETGDKQPEAVRLYERIGYIHTAKFGPHRTDAHSICFEKLLPTRVLVISGTIGAGKTTVGWAVSDVLAERGVRHAIIDGDRFAQAEPAPGEDPYNQELMFACLREIAPLYRDRGYGCIVLPRVVEDDADRRRYEDAFGGPAGVAQVSVVRVTASEGTRRERLRRREPEGKWLDWALDRTVELEAILADARIEDAIVENDGRERLEVATEVLEAVGW